MATEFLRMYRELCHVDPNAETADVTFFKERKTVFRTLGYEIEDDNTKIVERTKHHGKAARRRILEAHLNAISPSQNADSKRQREIHAMEIKTQQINEVTNQIQALMLNNKYVSPNLWSKYDKIYGESISSNIPKINKSQTQTNQWKNLPSLPRQCSVIRTDYSHHKWTKEEMKKLNIIYLELEKPKHSSEKKWEIYLEEFSNTFLLFFDTKSKQEIIDKIKELYISRQFKEEGEEVYWNNVQVNSPMKVKLAQRNDRQKSSSGVIGEVRRLSSRGKSKENDKEIRKFQSFDSKKPGRSVNTSTENV